ncbi:MAG: rhodanese-like domain-containing protein [Calditrichaeota bacterium]|nr:rhodanese-like domain-containing protein [Calditrichota bacterium]
MMKNRKKLLGKQVLLIILFAIIVSFVVNFFHPRAVKISFQRPPLAYASDSVFAEQLPPVSIETDEKNGFSEGDDLPVVGFDQLNRIISENKALLIDAREEVEFQAGHLPNAINIPYERYFEFEEIIQKLPHDKWLVCYCDGSPCDLGTLLAEELKLRDFAKVAVYEGGLNDWKAHGKSKGARNDR